MTNKLIISNWKLNGNQKLIKNLIRSLNDFFIKKNITKLTLIITPPCIYLLEAQKLITQPNIMLGAQNVDIYSTGAYTGAISVYMLKDIGVQYIIIGHSERRLYYKENNDLIANKFKIVKDCNLVPILCIGETLIEYKLKQTKLVCKKQLDAIIKKVGSKAFNDTIIAYEPIWAIGSGKIPSSNFIKDVINFIINYICNIQNSHKKNFLVQYGGSVNLNNIMLFNNIDNLDGLLVGSASLEIDNFLKIISTYCRQ